VAEREARPRPGVVVPAVADQQALPVVEPAVGGHRVQHRAVGLGGRDRDRQPAARLGPPEQHVGERGAHLLARQPRVADRRDLVRPGQQDRHAGVHHHDRPFVHRRHPPDEFVLPAG
jgi:hypothetical protein